MILIVIIFEMCGDDYFILTINPLNLIIIFLIYNSKYNINSIKILKNRKRILKRTKYNRYYNKPSIVKEKEDEK